MKRLVCLAVGIMLLFSAAVAEEHTSDELLGFWSWIGYQTTKTTTETSTTHTTTVNQYALFLQEEGQGLWYDTETGISELPVTWSSNEHAVTIQGENLNLILPVSNVEGKIYLIAPNGERMENMSASSDDDDAATPTPEPTATPAPVPEDKYSEDGEACLVMDRDQVQIYLMGTYEDDGPFNSILVDIVVVNESDDEIDLWYDGMANGWTIGEDGLLNSPVCHAKSKTRAQMLLDKKMIGVDTAKELETLEITFKLYRETGTALLGDLIFEQSTGVIHLHSAL